MCAKAMKQKYLKVQECYKNENQPECKKLSRSIFFIIFINVFLFPTGFFYPNQRNFLIYKEKTNQNNLYNLQPALLKTHVIILSLQVVILRPIPGLLSPAVSN